MTIQFAAKVGADFIYALPAITPQQIVKQLGANDHPDEVGTNKTAPAKWRTGIVNAPHGVAFNTDGDLLDKTNLADITRLIDHVYISKAETAGCL